MAAVGNSSSMHPSRDLPDDTTIATPKDACAACARAGRAASSSDARAGGCRCGRADRRAPEATIQEAINNLYERLRRVGP